MSSLPVPKYSIGDKVFTWSINEKRVILPCPDCQGKKVWSISSPAGETYDLECPRCTIQWTSTDVSLSRIENCAGTPRSLTIGSVRIDTAEKYGSVVKYMCMETGVGSGSIWDENHLFESAEEAFEAGKIKADLMNKESPWIQAAILRVDEIARLNIKQALFSRISDSVKKSAEDRLKDHIEGLESFGSAPPGPWALEYNDETGEISIIALFSDAPSYSPTKTIFNQWNIHDTSPYRPSKDEYLAAYCMAATSPEMALLLENIKSSTDDELLKSEIDAVLSKARPETRFAKWPV